MSYDEFEKEPEHSHPEVDTGNPETRPADQVTLRHLLHEVTVKSQDGYDQGGGLSIGLHHPITKERTASVIRYEEGTPAGDLHEKKAYIRFADEVISPGPVIYAHYFMFETPAGLEIKKYTEMVDVEEEVRLQKSSPSEYVDLLLGRQNAREEAKKSEDELGQTFVSEQEARELLSALDELVPNRKIDIN